MTTADTFERPSAEPALLRIAGIAAGVGACAYAVQAWMADSAYGFELSHRPLAVALWAATWAADWTEVFKVVVVVGASLAVKMDSGRRLIRGPEAAR